MKKLSTQENLALDSTFENPSHQENPKSFSDLKNQRWMRSGLYVSSIFPEADSRKAEDEHPRKLSTGVYFSKIRHIKGNTVSVSNLKK
jgi:hypothetical protein